MSQLVDEHAISSMGMRLREYSRMVKFVPSSAVVRDPEGIFSWLGMTRSRWPGFGGYGIFFAVFSGRVVDVVISDFSVSLPAWHV